MKRKVIVFGAAENSQKLYNRIREDCDIIAYTDNDEAKWGGKTLWTPYSVSTRIDVAGVGRDNYSINNRYVFN